MLKRIALILFALAILASCASPYIIPTAPIATSSSPTSIPMSPTPSFTPTTTAKPNQVYCGNSTFKVSRGTLIRSNCGRPGTGDFQVLIEVQSTIGYENYIFMATYYVHDSYLFAMATTSTKDEILCFSQIEKGSPYYPMFGSIQLVQLGKLHGYCATKEYAIVMTTQP